MNKFELPEEITEIRETDPRDLIIIAQPKMGKTNICASLTLKENAVIFNLDRSGTDYIKGRFIDIFPNTDGIPTSYEEAMANYKGFRDSLIKNKGKYKYLIIDSLTDLNDLSEIFGTYYYMYSVPQGKNWNRNPKNANEVYSYGHPEFKLVTTMGEGYGYKYTREWFLDQVQIFSEVSPYRIYIAHVKDKLIKNSQDETVSGSEINLTGKLKQILSVKISTLCKLVADGNKRYLSFDVDNDNVIAGSRVPRLKGQVLISEKKDDDSIVTYWENVYKSMQNVEQKA